MLIAIRIPAKRGEMSKWLIYGTNKQFKRNSRVNFCLANLEAWIDAAVQTNSNRQQENSQNSIAASVRHDGQAYRRPELSNAVENFSSGGDAEFVSGDEPVSDHWQQYRRDPHAKVRNRWEKSVLWRQIKMLKKSLKSFLRLVGSPLWWRISEFVSCRLEVQSWGTRSRSFEPSAKSFNYSI